MPQHEPGTVAQPILSSMDRLYGGLPVGTVAIRIFSAARKRRLALPPEQRKTPDPGLIAELRRRGWDLPEDQFGPPPP